MATSDQPAVYILTPPTINRDTDMPYDPPMNTPPTPPHPPTPAAATSACAKCRTGDQALRILMCGGCYLIGYCSKQCQMLHWKTHKAACAASRPDYDPSQYHDSISQLIERVDSARFQQSRPRMLAAFINPQDVIRAAERTYKDALREAQALLTCEPEYRAASVRDLDLINIRLEWVDECEKVLGKSQAALQTLNMFQKKLEVVPVLVGSEGPFVGQAKKILPAPLGALSEIGDTLVWDSEPCTRCRTNRLPCGGKQGRACTSCKKQKVACNFSSARPAKPRGSERSTSDLPHDRHSPATSSSSFNLATTNITAASTPIPASSPTTSTSIIDSSLDYNDSNILSLKRKRSVEPLQTLSYAETPALKRAQTTPNTPNIQCDRCWTSNKTCHGPIGRPCTPCKTSKLGCSFSNAKNASGVASAVSQASGTQSCIRCTLEDKHCVGTAGHACNSCRKSKTKCSNAAAHQRVVRTSAPYPSSLGSHPAPQAVQSGGAHISTILSISQGRYSPVDGGAASASSTSTVLSVTPSIPVPIPTVSPGAPRHEAHQERPEVHATPPESSCKACLEQRKSCWGAQGFNSSAGFDGLTPTSCWPCLQAGQLCSKTQDARGGKAPERPGHPSLRLVLDPNRPLRDTAGASFQSNASSPPASYRPREPSQFPPTWDTVAVRHYDNSGETLQTLQTGRNGFSRPSDATVLASPTHGSRGTALAPIQLSQYNWERTSPSADLRTFSPGAKNVLPPLFAHNLASSRN